MIYLNNSSTSYPKPTSVVNSINDYLIHPPMNFGRGESSRNSFIKETREFVLSFFNAKDNYNLIFTSGSTESLNLVINGLELEDNEVIITSTEHNSVIRPLKFLENKGKIKINFANIDSDYKVNLNDIKNLVNTRTALIVINHVSNVTGCIQNVKEIAEFANQNNIKILIDGSQAVGNISVDLDDIDANFYVFTNHKYLYGLQGSGGLFIRKDESFTPLKFGGTGFKSQSLIQPNDLPYKYESGTQNIPAIVALRSGIEFVINEDLQNIIDYKKNLFNPIFEQLNNKKIKFYCNKDSFTYSALSFNIEGIAPEEVAYILQSSFEIEIRAGLHCCPLIHNDLDTNPFGTCRISPSYFTTPAEIEIFISAIEQILSDFE